MFCQKCGAKVPEEAEFCLKCGTKLITESKPTEPVSAAPGQQPNGFDEKQSKKKKKLPFILGVIALLIVILAIVGTSGEEVNYAAMVQGHKPFESYDLPYTFDEVLTEYMEPPIWRTSSWDERTSTAIVQVDGTIRGTENKLIVSFEVIPVQNGCHIWPQSINLNGTEYSGQEATLAFLKTMFEVYDSGAEYLPGVLSEGEAVGQQENMELTEEYSNTEMGISFRYPGSWELFEVGGMSTSISHNADGNIAVFEVVNTWDSNPFGIFTDEDAVIEAALSQSGDTTVLSIEDATISGIPARVVSCRTSGSNGTELVDITYYYMNGDTAYRAGWSCNEATVSTYQDLFDAILTSFTITPLQTDPPAQDTGETAPPPEDSPSSAPVYDFAGTWTDSAGTYQVDISVAGDTYTIEATQKLSDSEWRQWSLEGYEEGNGIFYSGMYVDLWLREDGTVGGGAAANDAAGTIFTTADGVLHWASDTGELDGTIEFTKQ